MTEVFMLTGAEGIGSLEPASQLGYRGDRIVD
jgi:hypothetical protein